MTGFVSVVFKFCLRFEKTAITRKIDPLLILTIKTETISFNYKILLKKIKRKHTKKDNK